MERYQNLSGRSSITGYEISDEQIVVEYDDGSAYLFTKGSIGAGSVTEMARLARSGYGLYSYIAAVVKKRRAKRIR